MSSHSVRCADAVRTTRKQCKCMCDGVMHGGPHTERARALIWPLETRKKYSQRQVSNSKKVAREAVEASEAIGEVFTDLLVRHIVNELVHEQALGDQDLARDTLKDLICPFVDKVMEAELDDSDSKRIAHLINFQHILCSLCVEVIKIADELNQATDDAISKLAESVAATIVTAISGSNQSSSMSLAVEAVLKVALKEAFKSIIPYVIDPQKIDFLRFSGIAVCPNIDAHSEVNTHCLKPLEKKWATEALKQWVGEKFPTDTEILNRAKPRPKSP